ncbi:hypothetical protein DMUE_2957 [Dictyocoela muelleri]|nr:hypothetical protein DMUE_2957 [Dictyocoela muelleri]
MIVTSTIIIIIVAIILLCAIVLCICECICCTSVAICGLPCTLCCRPNIRIQTTNARTNNRSSSNRRVRCRYNDILPPPEYNEIPHPPDYNEISHPPKYNKNEINPSPENNTTDNLTIINEINVNENDENYSYNISSVTYTNECPNKLNK